MAMGTAIVDPVTGMAMVHGIMVTATIAIEAIEATVETPAISSAECYLERYSHRRDTYRSP